MRDQIVVVAIYLEQDELPLLSAARVGHVSREPDGGYVIIGMEFLGLDATVQGRSVKRCIEQFAAVSRLQCGLLKRQAGQAIVRCNRVSA